VTGKPSRRPDPGERCLKDHERSSELGQIGAYRSSSRPTTPPGTARLAAQPRSSTRPPANTRSSRNDRGDTDDCAAFLTHTFCHVRNGQWPAAQRLYCNAFRASLSSVAQWRTPGRRGPRAERRMAEHRLGCRHRAAAGVPAERGAPPHPALGARGGRRARGRCAPVVLWRDTPGGENAGEKAGERE
jgi:hypothetical protein